MKNSLETRKNGAGIAILLTALAAASDYSASEHEAQKAEEAVRSAQVHAIDQIQKEAEDIVRGCREAIFSAGEDDRAITEDGSFGFATGSIHQCEISTARGDGSHTVELHAWRTDDPKGGLEERTVSFTFDARARVKIIRVLHEDPSENSALISGFESDARTGEKCLVTGHGIGGDGYAEVENALCVPPTDQIASLLESAKADVISGASVDSVSGASHGIKRD